MKESKILIIVLVICLIISIIGLIIADAQIKDLNEKIETQTMINCVDKKTVNEIISISNILIDDLNKCNCFNEKLEHLPKYLILDNI